jgi:hypothetical protein
VNLVHGYGDSDPYYDQFLDRDIVDSVPTAKQFQALGTLIPRATDQKLFVDGMGIVASTAPGTNGFYFTDGNYQEFVLDVAASPAEQETGGMRINMVPRDGGNTLGALSPPTSRVGVLRGATSPIRSDRAA